MCREQKEGRGQKRGLRRRTSGGEKASKCYSLKSKKGNFPKEKAVVTSGEMPEELKEDMNEK
jgi:hypothetical protein